MPNKVVNGIAWTTASSLVRNFVSFIQIAVLTRFLDKASFGVVAIAGLFVSFTTLFLDMGISAGILHKQVISKKEYSSLFWLNIVLGVFLTFLLFILSPLLTRSYHSEALEVVVKWLCFTVFLNSIGNQQRVVCQKSMLFKRLAVIEIISSIITFTVAFITAARGFGVMSLAYSTLAGTVFNNYTHLFIGLVKDNRIQIHFRIKETFPFLKIGVYSVGSQILDFFSRELDIMIVSATLGLEFTGVYNIAKRIPLAIYRFISPLLSRVFTPFFAKNNNDIFNIQKKYFRLSHAIAGLGFICFFPIAAFAPTIMSLAFGPDYVEGAIILTVFSIMYGFHSFMGICGTLQVSLGRTDIGLYWTLFGIVSTAIIYYISSRFGITWFLIGILFRILLDVYALWLIQYKTLLSISFRAYFNAIKKPLIICSTPCMMVALLYYNVSVRYLIVAGVALVMTIIFALLRLDEPFWKELAKDLNIKPLIKIVRLIAK